jgi:hypothetical protein
MTFPPLLTSAFPSTKIEKLTDCSPSFTIVSPTPNVTSLNAFEISAIDLSSIPKKIGALRMRSNTSFETLDPPASSQKDREA